MRHAEHLAVEHYQLPVVAEQHVLAGVDLRLGQRVDHRRLEIMIARQPDAGFRQAYDALSEVLIGFDRVILSEIAGGDNQIVLALLRRNGVQHRVITRPGIHAQQRFIFSSEKVGVRDLQNPDPGPIRRRKC